MLHLCSIVSVCSVEVADSWAKYPNEYGRILDCEAHAITPCRQVLSWKSIFSGHFCGTCAQFAVPERQDAIEISHEAAPRFWTIKAGDRLLMLWQVQEDEVPAA